MLGNITRREEYDLFAAWLAVSLSFAIIKLAPYGVLGPIQPVNPATALTYLVIALLTAGIGLVLHELAHKFAAIKFGFWAEFHKNNFMLLVAVALAALVGFVFAAPGATVIYSTRPDGRTINREENGMISAAGPVTNLVLCIPFAVLIFATAPQSLLYQIGIFGVQINAMIAAFNMLPISILDGNKVLSWNIPAFVLLIAASFAVLVSSFYIL
ncbi:peptidase M50 [Methanoregula boonei 6A8]|jgi:Zn-dependent protease|uniref:Peptidase M50 n=1 Tax=Methanoregula boonei (strain DSM 21154 / JCM 14090 / 6A8) TaxID=456442 RepID=A7I4D8_METB6|nr:peptidase M50 [Methanoregula boonei]ABS54599.1 peptidase M50 [Methanoregula boonei 6A8]